MKDQKAKSYYLIAGLFFTVAFFAAGFRCPAQPYISLTQLKANISVAPSAAKKLNALFAFCDEWESYSQDTLKKYAEEAKQIAISQKDSHSTVLANYYEAVWLFQVNKLDSALSKTNQVLKDYKSKFPYDEMFVKIYALRGNILLRTEKMDELMAQDFEWMKLSEQHKDTLGIARAKVGLGNVDLKLKKYPESLVWYAQALDLMHNPSYRRKLSFIYNNISIIFYHLENEDSALYYVQQGIRYSKEDGNFTNLANALYLYGGLLAEFNHLKEAEENFKAAVEVRKKVGDVYYLITDMAQLALFYADNKNPGKGISLCKEALSLGEKNTLDYNSLNSIYESLAKNYQVAGNYKDYSETLVKQMSLKDSLYKKNSAEAMAEIQTKYDLQKKENTIIEQKLALISKNYQLYGSLAMLLLAIIAGYLVFIQYRKKQKLRLQLIHEEETLKGAKAIKDAEESERERISRDLHDNLGAYASAIVSEAENLQDVSSKDKKILENLKANAAEIMVNLRDTIWALNKQAIDVTGISDRFKNYVKKIEVSYPGKNISINENIEVDRSLSPALALNLYRILQEALNNSLKHSEGDLISVDIQSHDKVQFSVTDNGRGFTFNTNETSYGLQNMKARAKAVNLDLSIEKNTPIGTKINITTRAN